MPGGAQHDVLDHFHQTHVHAVVGVVDALDAVVLQLGDTEANRHRLAGEGFRDATVDRQCRAGGGSLMTREEHHGMSHVTGLDPGLQ